MSITDDEVKRGKEIGGALSGAVTNWEASEQLEHFRKAGHKAQGTVC